MDITYDYQPGKLYFRSYIYRQEYSVLLEGDNISIKIIIKCWPITSEYLVFLLPYKITTLGAQSIFSD